MVVAAYGLILPRSHARHQALHQYPRLAAAALARRRADPPRDRSRRRRDRRHHHGDGRRPGHRPDAADRAHRHRTTPTPPAACTTSWPRWAARMIVDALRTMAAGRAGSRAAAGRRRDLRRQDQQGRSEAGLARCRPSSWRARCAPSIPSRARMAQAGGDDDQDLECRSRRDGKGRPGQVLAADAQRHRGGLRRGRAAPDGTAKAGRQALGGGGVPEGIFVRRTGFD